MGIWKLRVLGEILIRRCVLYAIKRKDGVILRCKGTRSWSAQLVHKRFTSADPEFRI
jgi:hypothetical protein